MGQFGFDVSSDSGGDGGGILQKKLSFQGAFLWLFIMAI
jgi:hypothetical protein